MSWNEKYRLEKYWWQIFFGIFFIVVNSCTHFTVIYDQQFHKHLMNTSQVRNYTRINLIPLNEQNGNLQNITSRFTEFDKDHLVLMFTNNDVLYQKLLLHQSLVLSFGLTLENMVEHNLILKEFFCLALNQSLLNTLTALTISLSERNIAIVTNEEQCARQFYSSLKRAISTHKGRKYRDMYVEHFIHCKRDFTTDLKTVGNSFDELKLFQFDVIILLVGRSHIPLVLRDSINLGLLQSSANWLIPGYSQEFSPFNWFPRKLLSFELKEHSFDRRPYKRLLEGISDLINLYEVRSQQSSSQEVLMELYKSIQRIEEEGNVDQLQLSLRYLDHTPERPRIRNKTTAEIDYQYLYVNSDEIPILSSTTQIPQKHVKAVTVLNEPWTMDREDLFDSYHDICKAGLTCWKPVRKDKGIVYQKTCCTGFIIDLFELILKYSHFEYTLYVVEDGKYGGIGEDGKWNGMIGDLVAGKAEIAIAALTSTESRAEVVDFTFQFFDDRMAIVYRPHWSTIEFINFHFISVLSSRLKITLLLVAVGTVFVIYVFENTVYKIGFPKQSNTVKSYYNLYESMTYIGGVTLQRDLGGVLPRRYGARLAAILFAFSLVVFVTTFTALLAASRIQDVEHMPFNGSSDARLRHPTSEFKFGTVKDTSYHTRFLLSNNDVIKRISRFMDEYNTNTAKEGIKKVANGELQAFLYQHTMITWLIQKYNLCELKVLQDKLFEGMASFAMNKNFKWSTKVNEAIRHYYYNTKEISNIHMKWFPSGCYHQSHPVPLAIGDFGGLIFVLCVAAVALILFLIPEHFYKRHRSRHSLKK